MSPTTKEERASQFLIKAKYEYHASPGYRPGPGVRIQTPTGSGGRPSIGQDGVLWDEDGTPRQPSRQEAQSTTLAIES